MKKEKHLIEQEPERFASSKDRAALLALNQVPWSTQTAFIGVLWTLIPWIGFTLILNALGIDFGLRPESETRFTVDAIDALVTFVKDGNGEVSEVVFRLNAMNLRARRVK